jgi:hypothetical protein
MAPHSIAPHAPGLSAPIRAVCWNVSPEILPETGGPDFVFVVHLAGDQLRSVLVKNVLSSNALLNETQQNGASVSSQH